MSADSLIQDLPDLVLLVKRDGLVVALSGGHGVGDLRPPEDAVGKRLEEVWPEAAAALIRQLARKAISLRTAAEAKFQQHGREYEARAIAQSPDRALCVIRALSPVVQDGSLDTSDERPRPQIDRRGFLRRMKESMYVASLREKPIAVAVIHVEGIADIAQIIGGKLSEQIMGCAIFRVPAQFGDRAGAVSWYLGQLNDSMLALVLETSYREAIEACVSRVCDSLRETVSVGESEFHLTPFAGVAILGQDASAPKLLLEHARSAAGEARRTGSRNVYFFTDG